ncbi:hypothetical protein OAJ08_04680 [Candidatus Nitrosopelagicus sp.]|nr:hypothetical protein [Candidatus Nitrosopelagicus sp.]
MKLKIVYITALIFSFMIPSAFADTVSTEIDSTNYDIVYTGNNVVLKSATADLDFISLIFDIEVSGSEGDVSITFQRDFFDAKLGYSDDDFFILSDGDEIEFAEVKTDESRTLSFSLSAGTEEIEIIGTILANNSFLIEQEQQAKDSAAQAQADAEATAQAQADAEAAAKNAEEEKLDKLMNACGDGTVYENGECVLSAMEKNASDMRTGPLIYSVVIGMSIGIVIMMILWGIGKKSHKVLSDDDS